MKNRSKEILLVITAIFLMGFDFSKHGIPLDEILSGGPEKDGIPAILKPVFIPADRADFLKNDDRVLAFELNGEAKAYPIKILNWHEIVNDTIGGRPILVTYCPLCGTGMAFDPMIEGKRYTFGVSGLLYKSDVLMYDHQTESLWSQIQREAVTGPLTGTRLKLLPLVHTTWGAWRAEHPKTQLLSTDTGYKRDYTRDPYESYARSDRLMFPVGKGDDRLSPKAWVLGIELDGIARAYPFSELERSPKSFTDLLGSKRVILSYDRASRTARIRDNEGRELPAVVAYWFAWAAFHPKTEVYRRSPSRGERP